MITKTLAEIYLKQGHLQEAFQMFKVLAERDPANQEFQERLRDLKQKLESSSVPEEALSMEEKIDALENWLRNIRRRKGEESGLPLAPESEEGTPATRKAGMLGKWLSRIRQRKGT